MKNIENTVSLTPNAQDYNKNTVNSNNDLKIASGNESGVNGEKIDIPIVEKKGQSSSETTLQVLPGVSGLKKEDQKGRNKTSKKEHENNSHDLRMDFFFNFFFCS